MIYNGYNRRLEGWIINHQTGRRNLTKSQLVKAYASVEEQLKREAKERQSAGGGDKKSDKAKSVGSNLNQAIDKKRNPKTSQVIAGKIGVSENTYRNMKQIVSEGTPEQIKRMNKGGKGNGVSAIVAEIKEEKQAEAGGATYQKSKKSSMPTMNTAKEVAKIAGVSHDTIHRVEVRIGKLLKQIPKTSGGDRKSDSFKNSPHVDFDSQKPKSQVIKENGLTQRQAEHFQIMADNPDSVARAKEKARWSKRPK